MGYVIGVDEAGRGALAGPVCVGAVLYPEDFDWREVFALITKRGEPKLRDSKKLTAQHRTTLFEYIAQHGRLKHVAGLVGSDVIDAIGIVNATNEAAALAIHALGVSAGKAKVLLDAGLRAPTVWEQESFVRGDEHLPAISLASIVAKVTRDRHMDQLADEFDVYSFEKHKGYGTRDHVAAIRKNGLSREHRRSFCGAFRV